MKSIAIVLFLSISLLAMQTPCSLDVYYGNGVWNDSMSAEKSRDKLKRLLQRENPEQYPLEEEGKSYNFKHAHNQSYGAINDLIETHWQLYESGQVHELYFSFMISTLNGIDSSNEHENALRQRVLGIISRHDIDVENMLDMYRKSSFNKRHNVLLVAHSQGNLFGNKVHSLFTAMEKEKFQMVSVATPANTVAGDSTLSSSYTTLSGDLVISLVPNSLVANANGSGHSFVESYLYASIDGVERILSDIKTATSTLSKEECPRYEKFHWVSYACPNSEDASQELEVHIYAKEVLKWYLPAKIIASDTKKKVADCTRLFKRTYTKETIGHEEYDTQTCNAYTFASINTGAEAVESIEQVSYADASDCTEYKMARRVTTALKNFQ